MVLCISIFIIIFLLVSCFNYYLISYEYSWIDHYHEQIRPLNYYTPNFRDFRKGDTVAKKLLLEYKPIAVTDVDKEKQIIKYIDSGKIKEEKIDSDTLYDYESYRLLKDHKYKDNNNHSKSNSCRPATSTYINNNNNDNGTLVKSDNLHDNDDDDDDDDNSTSITNAYSKTKSSESYSTHSYYSHYHSSPPAPGVVGLSNIGNTCFMDSMLQCMSNCQPLTEYFLSGEYVHDINETNPIGTKGELARSYANLLDNLWNGNSSVFTPSDFKHTIGRHAPRFAGYEQQDSSELMNYLLDGLHEDLNKIKNKPYIEGVETDGKSLVEAAEEYWKVHLARNTSKIVDIFCAQLRSHLVCPNCGNASDIFDPYYSLSLPIPDKIVYKANALYYNDFNKPPLKLTLEAGNDEIEDFEVALRNVLSIPVSDKLLNMDYTDGELSGRPSYGYYRYRGMNVYCYFNVTKITKKFNSYCQTLDPSVYYVANNNSSNGMEEEEEEIVETDQHTHHHHNHHNDSSTDSDDDNNNNNNNNNNNFGQHHNHNHHQQQQQHHYGSSNNNNRNNGNSARDECNKLSFVNFKIERSGGGYGHNKYYYPQMYPIEINTNNNGNYNDNEKKERLVKKLVNEYIEEKYITDYKSDNFYKNRFDIILKEDIPVEVCNKLDEVVLDPSFEKSNSEKKKDITLNDCIELLLREEVLSEDDKWHCPKCKEFVRASKKFYLWSLPEILIIHLKRFSVKMDKRFSKYGYGSREKLETLVDYPEHINLSDYVDGPNKENCKYSLYAVSEHSGSLSFGHYTAKCKNFKNGKWYDFNDSSVSQCNGPSPSRCDYVLFYQRDKS